MVTIVESRTTISWQVRIAIRAACGWLVNRRTSRRVPDPRPGRRLGASTDIVTLRCASLEWKRNGASGTIRRAAPLVQDNEPVCDEGGSGGAGRDRPSAAG